MNKFFAAVALTMLLVSPAFGQSYDPHLGSGNIAPHIQAAPSAADAFAREDHPAAPRRLNGSAARRAAQAAHRAFASFGASTEGERATALRGCSSAAGEYKQTTWGSMELHAYRACMAAHGQTE
jgi:hypothetical protein